jgi:multiple sugar transport system substrate-binding protein
LVVFEEMELFKEYIKQNRLVNLDAYIERDEFDLQNIHPTSVSILQNAGEGAIYGLSPTFTNGALLYNKTLFDQYQVTLPTDGMTWREIMELALQFPTVGTPEQRIYGLRDGLSTFVLDTLGGAEGLSYYDPDSRRVTLDTREWKDIFTSAVEYLKSDVISATTSEDRMEHLAFIAGRAAMSIIGNKGLSYLNGVPFEWGIVETPASSNHKQESTYFTVHGDIYAIPESSSSKEGAWEFIKFVNSEQEADRLSFSYAREGELLARTAYITNETGVSLEVFTQEQQSLNDHMRQKQEYPHGFTKIIRSKTDEMINTLLNGEKPIDTALKELEVELQKGIDEVYMQYEAQMANAKANVK